MHPQAEGIQSRGVTEPQRDLGGSFFQNCLQFGFPPGVPLVPLFDKPKFEKAAEQVYTICFHIKNTVRRF